MEEHTSYDNKMEEHTSYEHIETVSRYDTTKGRNMTRWRTAHLVVLMETVPIYDTKKEDIL
jgi:hypothetical protein